MYGKGSCFFSQGLCQTSYCKLAPTIHPPAGKAAQESAYRGDIEDPSRSLLPQMAHTMPDHVQHTKNIDFKVFPAFFIRHFFQCTDLPVAGVVDDDINAAKIDHA